MLAVGGFFALQEFTIPSLRNLSENNISTEIPGLESIQNTLITSSSPAKLGININIDNTGYTFGKMLKLNSQTYFLQSVFIGDINLPTYSNSIISLYSEYAAIVKQGLYLYNARIYFRDEKGLILSDISIENCALPLSFDTKDLFHFSYPKGQNYQILPILQNRLLYFTFRWDLIKTAIYYLTAMIFLWIVGAVGITAQNSISLGALSFRQILTLLTCYPLINLFYAFLLLISSLIIKVL